MQKIFQKKLEVFTKKNKSKVNIYVVFHPIGYKKHYSIKNKLVIDENTADIVRKIFDMYANEHSTLEIVNYLNSNKYLSPTGYRKTGLVRDENKTNYNWNEVTLCNMLKNEVYIGNTIQNKKTVVSYKVKKIRSVKKEKQIRVNNTHSPLIDKDIFEKVQCIISKKGTNSKLKYDYFLRGLLYCHHCKRKLQIVLKNNSKKNTKSYPYITCSNHKSRGCFPININYKKFEKHIFYIVKKIVQTYADKNLFYSVYEKYQEKTLNIKEDFIKKIEQTNKTILEINNNLDKMYMDKLKGVLLEDDYIKYSQKFNLERTNLKKQKKELQLKLTQMEEEIYNKQKENIKLNDLIENFLKFEKIDKMYLYRLINKIEIDKDKNVYIFFNFSKPNFIAENLNEFINIEKLFDKNKMQQIN